MTLFEYLAVLISIVLSFGVIRLLEGIPLAVKRGRRYWIHAVWVVSVLWLHVQFWWVFWSYNGVTEWNYPRFSLVLLLPFLSYSLAITLVPREPGAVESWRAYFRDIRVRFFVIFACWLFAAGLANWLVLGQPYLNPLRIGQTVFVGLFLSGAVIDRERYQGFLAILVLLMWAAFMSLIFIGRAPIG